MTITFLALLALIALGGALALVALKRSPGATLAAVGPYLNSLAGAVAVVATAGSLFMSEVAGFTPFRLSGEQDPRHLADLIGALASPTDSG